MARRLRHRYIAQFSRQLGTMLEGGIPIRQALALLEKNAKPPQRELYGRLGHEVDGGASLLSAMEKEGDAFPTLFKHLVRVGETAGGLDHVMLKIAEYYEFMRSLRMRMLSNLAWPLFEYAALTFVLTLVTWIRATFLEPRDPHPNLKALAVFAAFTGAAIVPVLIYKLVLRRVGATRTFHELALRIPVLGWVLRCIALARFSWCMEMTTNSGVRITEALTLSLQATDNAAYIARIPRINEQILNGAPLSETLDHTGLFPQDYIEMLHVGETSGSMPDIFMRLAKRYFETVDSAMKALATAVGLIVMAIVAAIIIYYIFQFWNMYVGGMNQVLNAVQ